VNCPAGCRLWRAVRAGVAEVRYEGIMPAVGNWLLSPDFLYRVPEMDALEWLVHGFGTRSAYLPAQLTTLKQIHSATCVFAEGRSGALGEGDALLDNTPGSTLAIKTADCVPILLVDERLRAVAAVHAGWRGTVAGIAQRAVAAMRQRFGSSPADLHAALGPAIGKCCYEVGPEVAIHFGAHGRARVDLTDANRGQLLAAGLSENHIYAAGLCTMCLPEQFHSYRRDGGAAGRMYSFVGIVAPASAAPRAVE
jgi:polyphenol oxidase